MMEEDSKYLDGKFEELAGRLENHIDSSVETTVNRAVGHAVANVMEYIHATQKEWPASQEKQNKAIDNHEKRIGRLESNKDAVIRTAARTGARIGMCVATAALVIAFIVYAVHYEKTYKQETGKIRQIIERVR